MKSEGLAISGPSQKDDGEPAESSRSVVKKKAGGNGDGRKKTAFAEASPAIDRLPQAAPPQKANGRKRKNGIRTEEQLKQAILKVRVESSRRVTELAEGQDPAMFARAYSSAGIIQLFDDWAPTYDDHMKSTGHDPAVEILLKQAAELHKLSRDNHGWPIFGRRVCEMSCGTGTPIKFLSEIIPAEEFAQMKVTANDISTQMQALARVKLQGLGCRLEYTNHDVRDLPFAPGAFDTGMIINTLPFLTDPNLLFKENEEGFSKSEHRHVKTHTLRKFMDLLPWNGHLIVVDEWPALFTRRGSHIEDEIHRKFDDNARPINDYSTFRDKVMKNIPAARFVAELKARIDREHAMRIFIYRRDEDKVRNRYLFLPDDEIAASQSHLDLTAARRARGEAVERVVQAFKAIDPYFVSYYRPINGEKLHWAEFSPIGEGNVFDSRDPATAGRLGSNYDTAIVANILHTVSDEQRMTMLTNIVRSLNSGGALLIIDEWEPPAGSLNPIQKRTLRDTVIEQFHQQLIFEGALRETIIPGFDSGVYGYMFRKTF